MRRNGDVRDLDGAPDQDLIRSIASGQRQVLAILFRRRQQNIYRFVLHLTGSPAIADDVTQDVFIRVLSDAGRYDAERGSVAAWLCGIARNLVRRRLERDAAFEPLDTDDESETGRVSVSDDPLEDLTTTERLNALRHAVLSLPLRYREAVVACDLQELSYADGARAWVSSRNRPLATESRSRVVDLEDAGGASAASPNDAACSKVPGMTEEQERALIAGLKALAETTAEASASPRVEAAVVEAAGRLEPASTAAEAIRAGRLKPASTAAEAVRADWLKPASTAAESVRAGRKKPASPTAESPGRLLVEAGFSRPSSAHVSFGAADTAHVNVSRRTRWFTYAAAAVLLGTVASGVWLARRAHIPTAPIHPSGFVAIPGASALPPIESGSIQRVALHVTELPQYGVAIVPEITVERVQVDLLVAQDGIPRAIRLVDLSEESRSTP